MARSIRLRLLGWNAAVLAGVVCGFAGLLYYEVRAARLRDVDARLEAGAAGLESGLRLFPLHELAGEAPPPHFPRPHRPEPPEGAAARGLPPPVPAVPPEGFSPGGGPGPPFGRQPGPPPPRPRLLERLNLPGPREKPSGPDYFAVWRADGTVLKEAGYPPAAAGRPTASRRAVATRGANRELVTPGPGGTVLLVGTPCGNVYGDLRTFAWQLAGTGAAVLAVGLGGGWLISRRIFRPVDAIAGAAARISAANLSERIDTASLDAELAGLGRVLNETFGRLQEAFDRQARFTADASHELRTPLAVLRSQAELTLSRARTPEEYREALRACLRAAERMAELAERLLTLARADAGWPGAKREPVALERVVADVLAQLAPAAEAKGVTVERDLAPARTTGDAAALAQVVTNLVGNAIQYNRPSGRVAVRLAGGPGAATLAVEDNGVGIPEADRPRVFERFYRADKARSRASGGTGLGLAICKAVVEVHGGRICFEPTPGGGSTFRVTLPAAAAAAAGTPGGAPKGRSLG